MKKVFAILLCLCMLVSTSVFVQLYASAETVYIDGDFKFTVSNNKATITKYIGSDPIVTIPSTLNNYDVLCIGCESFYDCKSLTNITIPDGVTSIGDSAFNNCTSLTNITIPNSVTSIGGWAFSNCTSLTSITIPSSVTIMDVGVFYGCSTLTNITIPKNVTSIEFFAFKDCLSLTNIIIGDKVASIGDSAFYGCSSLTSIAIGSGLSKIGDTAFYGCSSLRSFNVNSNNKNYCDINGVLFDKDRTELIQYPIGKTATSYTIPDEVERIGDSAFSDCISLTSITIPNSITSIGSSAFYNTAYYNNDSNWENYVLCIGNYLISGKFKKYNDDEKGFETIFEVSGDYSIKQGIKVIADSAFNDCTSLTSITIPDSVTSIGDGALSSCTSLTSVTIPNSVTSIGDSAFSYCESLTSITIPNSVTSIGDYAFYSCTSLTSVTVPNSVTGIGDHAFYNCTSLTNITIPNIGDASLGFYYENETADSAKNPNFTIKGYKGSTAEKYANENGFKFISLDKPIQPTQPTTSTKPTQSVNKPTTNITPTVPTIKITLKTPKAKFISGKKQFKIKYTKVKNAVGFQVRYKIKGKWKIKTFNTKKSATKVLKGLKKGKYKVQIRSFSKGKKLYSNWTKVKTVKVK